jgi:tight adherence protein C
MSQPLLIVLLVAGGIVVVLFIIGLMSRKPEDSLQARLAEYSMREVPVTLEEIELSQPFRERVLSPMVQRAASFMARLTPTNSLESTRHKLDLAGNPNNWTPAEFFGIRAIATVAAAALTFLLLTITNTELPARLGMTAVFAVLGFLLPGLWLGGKIRSRKTNVIKALPDALDLLTICVEAGLGFDQAMQKVAEKWDNELSRTFARVLHEIRLGKTRRVALRDAAQRLDVSDVTSFVAAVIQSEQLGVSIAKVLRIQSDQMRVRRRQRAEEKAHQAPVKMLFPMVFLIFPSIWIVLLGPAVLQVIGGAAMGVF